MKSIIKELTEREITVPNFFRSIDSPEWYGMVISDKTFILVKDRLINYDSVVFPSIEMQPDYQFSTYFGKGFTSISEAEFKNAYIRTSLTIEKLLN
jgi:hypothetical protein